LFAIGRLSISMNTINKDKPESEPDLNETKVTSDEEIYIQDQQEIKLPKQLTDIIIRHEDDIRETVSQVKDIAAYIKRVDKAKGGSMAHLLFKYFSDKEYVIIGVVAIAICSMFVIPDPAGVIMSIVSGLFGLGTGRVMSNNTKDLDE
jgi:hypothetical protein